MIIDGYGTVDLKELEIILGETLEEHNRRWKQEHKKEYISRQNKDPYYIRKHREWMAKEWSKY